jgi:hypothetical protein
MNFNRINKSGKQFEDEVKDILEQSGHSYKSNKNSGIDYKITFEDRIDGIEVKAQKVGGSVDEKLPHSVYKYAEKYKNIVFLFHDNFKLNSNIQEHMEYIAKLKNVKLTLLWGLDKFKHYLNGNLKDDNSILNFC